MNATLRQNIDWVGYVDWTVRDFHGYHTHRGATYNSYLIRDEKVALIDTVKAPYVDTLLANVSALTDLDAIDYIVCNHAEPDHSGALARVTEALPNAVLLCSAKCNETLSLYHDTHDWNLRVVKTGDSVSLGQRTLSFIETPMVHWPDSMFTYVPEERLLFSMDGFGQHYASSARFDDEVPICVVMQEAKTYYANIVMPYGKRVAKVLEQASALDIEMIAPSHGVIWRKHIPDIVKAYTGWSVCRPECKVVVLYDTMWDSTAAMARSIHQGAAQAEGVDARLVHIRTTELTQIATEMLDVAAVALGSSTLNQDVLPMVAAVLSYIKGLRPVGKVGIAFGSYGWGKGSPEVINDALKAMRWEVLRDPIQARYKPTDAILDECRAAGQRLAQKAIEMTGGTPRSVDWD